MANRGARLDRVPSPGSTDNRIDVRWYFDGGLGKSFIRYNLKATTIPKTELRPAKKVRGFLPSTSGFHFINNFSTVTVSFTVGPVTVPLQGDRKGLIYLYDPNFPDNDQLVISFRIESDDRVSVISSPYSGMVGFFRNNYVRATPNRPPLGDNKKVAFKASNGKYVVAEDGGGGVVNANRDRAQSWETFTIERTRTGALTSGELVYLKACDGQHYVVAENRGGGAVNANRINPLGWERFVIDGVGARFGASLGAGSRVTLRTDGDRFLVPDGAALKATGDSASGAAEFVLEFK